GQLPLDPDSKLRAESAAHVLHDGSDAALVQAQRYCAVLRNAERALRGGVDGRGIAPAIVDDDAVRLKASVVNRLCPVLSFDDRVALFERGLDFVQLPLLFLFLEVALAEHYRRTRLDRRVGAYHVGQHFVLDLDRVNGVVCDLRSNRRRRGDWFSLVAQFLTRQRQLDGLGGRASAS